MLKHLRIQNIILIESADISFEPGFNVLSGETGSGKSAILHALSLITGERADPSVIRRGADKGVIEAVFDIDKIPQISSLLEERGIDHEAGDDLLIRREIASTGKSRAFINNQAAQLGLLRSITALLLDLVGQHANQKLLTLDTHREIIDLFGDLQQETARFTKNWREENQNRSELESLIHHEAQRLRDIDICHMELEELEAAKLKEDEDETLFAEYSRLVNAEALLEKVQDLLQALSGDKGGALTLLSRKKNSFDQLTSLDPALASLAQAYDNALVELHEVAHSLRNYYSRIEHNPERTSELNDRLTLIDRLKRRYGASIKEIQAYQQQAHDKLKKLQHADIEIDEIKNRIKLLEAENNDLAKKLTVRRRDTAKKMEHSVVQELQSLNMSKAKFHCSLKSQPRSQYGDDYIEFFMSPNVGEHQISVRECASGGELSRLMLALQALLAGKTHIPTLIFDEIDANIGGETAVVVGDKLKAIGEQHQVLCITHFPQVAKKGDNHIQISKMEQDDRTITVVRTLSKKERQHELARMSGKS